MEEAGHASSLVLPPFAGLLAGKRLTQSLQVAGESMHIYIYIYRERERYVYTNTYRHIHTYIHMHVCMYVCIYKYADARASS